MSNFFDDDGLDDEMFLEAESSIFNAPAPRSMPPQTGERRRNSNAVAAFALHNADEDRFNSPKITENINSSAQPVNLGNISTPSLPKAQSNASSWRAPTKQPLKIISSSITQTSPPVKLVDLTSTPQVPITKSPPQPQTKPKQTKQASKPPNSITQSPGAISRANSSPKGTLPRVDTFAASHWVYPTEYTKRDYQLNITRTALYYNTLVCLPTGLGKTFVAGVVMFNYYRWFPESKIIFMAHTKPLVTQQMEACTSYAAFDLSDVVLLTGETPASKRKKIWSEKRVFFCTPQILKNDLEKGNCDASNIVCLVMDEAHQAQGEYAYCTVVELVEKKTSYFRILALTATPGADKKAIQRVIENLRVVKMEVRTDESIDVRPYTHQREVSLIKVDPSDAMKELQDLLLTVLQEPIEWLHNQKVIHQGSSAISHYSLVEAKKRFQKRPPNHIPPPVRGGVEARFNMCITLYHSCQVLHSHGITAFSNSIQKFYESAGQSGATRKRFATSPDFVRLLGAMQKYTSPTVPPGLSPREEEEFTLNSKLQSHPKFEKLRDLLSEHYAKPNAQSTRVMIFCQFRDVVNEIVELISPLMGVRASAFLGQSGNKTSKGMTQKDQQRVVNQFRAGVFNTLVSTCIGEEGLDIGEVDLIICFDAQASPTRIVQRMGRTGRKRDGRCIILVTKGSEAASYSSSKSKKKCIFKTLSEKRDGFTYFTGNVTLVPSTVSKKPRFTHENDEDASPQDSHDTEDDCPFDGMSDKELLLALKESSPKVPKPEGKAANKSSSPPEKPVTSRGNGMKQRNKFPLFSWPYEGCSSEHRIPHSRQSSFLSSMLTKFPPPSAFSSTAKADPLGLFDSDDDMDLITEPFEEELKVIELATTQQKKDSESGVGTKRSADSLDRGEPSKTMKVESSKPAGLSAFAKWSYQGRVPTAEKNNSKPAPPKDIIMLDDSDDSGDEFEFPRPQSPGEPVATVEECDELIEESPISLRQTSQRKAEPVHIDHSHEISDIDGELQFPAVSFMWSHETKSSPWYDLPIS